VVTIVGAGLAGCEAAWQLAERGIAVRLIEQKPLARTPAQTSDFFAELVCSNSLRGAALVNAVGLLKEEMRRSGSFIMAAADATRVPAGGALAVDRERFGAFITDRIKQHPRITVSAEVVSAVPAASAEHPVILATGPLTGDALAEDLARLLGATHLAYYDAIAPIIAADSIDWDKVFRQSRWGKGEDGEEAEGKDASALGDEAYVNCPFDEAQYKAFVREVCEAKKVEPRAFEQAKFFEGCLPFEVMAARGEMTLAFGPMKPVGLTDPRTGRRPFAVVQLRAEDAAATAYNLVGFQTRLTYPEQQRVFRMIPGLEECEIQRYGTVHRNTFVDSPKVLGPRLEVKGHPFLRLAGQITGVEGYLESASSGFLCALLLAQELKGREVTPPPPTTALGGLLTHVSRVQPSFMPSNITWACMPPHENRRLKKRDRYQALAERALVDLSAWHQTAPGLEGLAQVAPKAPMVAQAPAVSA
jgi:methylenetetrahydrofolate--tRNA-(uracil-5-)-methyltransferase